MGKLNVAVLFGGLSEEHDVSVKSAAQIIGGMDVGKYVPYPIYINKTGEWRLCAWEGVRCGGGESTQVGGGGDVRHSTDLNLHGGEGAPTIISPDRKDHGILVAEGNGCRNIRIDVAFPVVHGKMGEDGRLQGLLDMSGIPYVGCGAESSVLAMDKSLTYMVARDAGISVPEFRIVAGAAAGGADMEYAEVNAGMMARLEYPVFVKPARSGSSFGVSKVNSCAELAEAIRLARRYDGKVLVEEAVTGYEVGCAVLGNGEELLTSEVDMITLSHGFFKIHQEEHPEEGSSNATVTVPADIPAETGERVKEAAKRVYRALGCRGLARVDMFLRED
ncbi:MAG: D-alanine--D-alanine ligase, partial [Clostridiales Family XIII bacterium]|nr:D-alanine--D-alanine ligase [Clostridiales Family XIII bacterium]